MLFAHKGKNTQASKLNLTFDHDEVRNLLNDQTKTTCYICRIITENLKARSLMHDDFDSSTERLIATLRLDQHRRGVYYLDFRLRSNGVVANLALKQNGEHCANVC